MTLNLGSKSVRNVQIYYNGNTCSGTLQKYTPPVTSADLGKIEAMRIGVWLGLLLMVVL